MKKYFFLIVAAMAFMMTNCKPDDPVDPTVDPSGDDPLTEVRAPQVVSKVVVNPNGFNTLFVQLHNPNNAAIDFTFDVEFIKNGQVVGNANGLYYNALPKNEDCMTWSNWGIPANPDEIRIVNLNFNRSVYQVVKMDLVKEVESSAGYLTLGFRTPDAFNVEADVEVVFYKNNQIVSHSLWSFFPGDVLEYTFEILDDYDSYKVFARAYSM